MENKVVDILVSIIHIRTKIKFSVIRALNCFYFVFDLLSKIFPGKIITKKKTTIKVSIAIKQTFILNSCSKL